MTVEETTRQEMSIEPELEKVREVPELINDGIDLVRRHRRILLRPFLATVAFPLVAGQILVNLFAQQAAYAMAGGYGPLSPFFSSGSSTSDFLLALVGFVLLFLGLSWSIAFYTAIIRASMESRREEVPLTEEHFMSVYRAIRSRALTGLLGLVGLFILALIPFFLFIRATGIVGAFVFFLFLFVALYYFVRLSLFFPARLLEERGVFDSLGRSMELVSGKWWKTFGLLVAVIILMTIITIGTYAPTLLLEMAAAMGLTEPIDPKTGVGIAVNLLLAALYGLGQAVGQGTQLFHALYFLGRRDALEGSSLTSRIEAIGGDRSMQPLTVPGSSEI